MKNWNRKVKTKYIFRRGNLFFVAFPFIMKGNGHW